jgi:uroporphyrin-III C-methyltransferase/precorrin-2 dehydrogenase/sirohydrochlorin ferrochelatase
LALKKGITVMFLPLFFKNGLPCLIVGGGRVASHKIKILLNASCEITLIAPKITGYAADEVQNRAVRWLERKYQEGDCMGFQLVIAATPFREVNQRISEDAGERGIPVNVVDDPGLSTVIFPAAWHEESLSIAVSTGGIAPFMAAEIRTLLGGYARGMGKWVDAGGRFRDAVRREVADSGQRNTLYRKFLDAGRPENIDIPEGEMTLDDWLSWLKETSGS